MLPSKYILMGKVLDDGDDNYQKKELETPSKNINGIGYEMFGVDSCSQD